MHQRDRNRRVSRWEQGCERQSSQLGRAEALRRAMLALIDKGKPKEARPAYWAPFIVVGEGAAK